jgi:tellurite resistance protein TehA-like permease
MGSRPANGDQSSSRLRRYAGEQLASLHPAYFAMSMATGIVSVACHLLGLPELSAILFWLNLAAYGSIWLATVSRAVLFPQAVLADWVSHQRGPGYFTAVAATGVVGTQFAQRGMPTAAFALWLLTLVLWALCMYGIFVALSIKEQKPSLADGINGGWLVGVVATQSVCVLGAATLPNWLADRDTALFVLTSFWLAGGMLYIWLISLIFYRYTFFRFSPNDLMPPYWINMGAVAITTLAGTALVATAGDSAFAASILPFVKGLTVLYWATATWWIPMLFILGVWRHARMGVRFSYDPLYWGLVFPLGMYSVATYRLMDTFGLPVLRPLARVFVTLAILAWLFTFFGLAARFVWVALLAWRDLGRPARPARVRASLRQLGSAGQHQPSAGGVS